MNSLIISKQLSVERRFMQIMDEHNFIQCPSEDTLYLAGAGAGKTTYLTRMALGAAGRTLITTFTTRNTEEIKKKILSMNHGTVPENIDVISWYSFLLKHAIRPYQYSYLRRFEGCDPEKRIASMILVNQKSGCKYKSKRGPVYYSMNQWQYFLSKDWKIYSDKISLFTVKCNENTNGAIIARICDSYDQIFIDEVQDLSGYDLEMLKLLIQNGYCKIILAGDPRQVTYHTHPDTKNKKYENGKIKEYLDDNKVTYNFDDMTLNRSFRCGIEICEFSSRLYPEYQKVESCAEQTCKHSGIFFVKPEDIDVYMQNYMPMQLQINKNSKNVRIEFPHMNMGLSKGSTFDHVLIYPTAKMLKWFSDPQITLADRTRADFYVALTRARYSVGVVCDNEKIFNREIEGIQQFRPSSSN